MLQVPARTTPIRFSIHGMPAEWVVSYIRRGFVSDLPTVPISPVTTQAPRMPAKNASSQLCDFKNESIAPSKLQDERFEN